LGKTAVIVYRVDKGIVANSGVVQKLAGQVEGLISLGLEVDYIIHDGSKIYKNQELITDTSQLMGAFSTKWRFWKHIPAAINQTYDLVIIRYTLMIPPQFAFIKRIKQRYPSSSIILDMPTYPYDDEWSGVKGLLGLFIDKIYRNKLSDYVDRITHSGLAESIFNIKTISMGNGISTHLIPDQLPSRKTSTTFNMIAVGKWQFWHGLDRLIKGMDVYLQAKPEREIHLHIVGDGPESAVLERVTATLNLDEQVTFHGSIVGQELLDLIDHSDIAIGTLGLYRKGVVLDSSLKHRLYCARGIPFVLSSSDRDFEKGLNFVHYEEPDQSILSITTLIQWYDRLDRALIDEEMMTHAKKYLTWNIKMKQLVAHFE
jgi:glycosyltransferase involved in cell wall biosynthesis